MNTTTPIWTRCRFKANVGDYRPVKWPPPGPYWCSGQNDEHATLIAYARSEREIKQYWPEAEDMTSTKEREIVYSDRFPKPEWWAKIEAESQV